MNAWRVLLTDYAWPNLDIEREILNAAGVELLVAEGTDEAALQAAAQGVDGILTNWAKVTAKVIDAAPRCRIVSRLGIGLDNIDVAHCTSRGIVVTNVPDYCLIEVAEHALALLLALARKVAYYHAQTKSGQYQLQSGPQLRRIEGQTLGIVGFGNIGRLLAAKAQGLGLKILATSRSSRELPSGVEQVPLDDLLSRSDYVSLHVPSTPETRHLIGAPQLARMKPSAYLVNTARGAVLDEQALLAALQAGQLAGAALDVQQQEPPDLSQPLWRDPRVIVTPHAAFVSEESLENLRRRAARQVVDRLVGLEPEHVVNPSVLAANVD